MSFETRYAASARSPPDVETMREAIIARVRTITDPMALKAIKHYVEAM